MGIGQRLSRIHAAGEEDHRHPVLFGIGDDIDRIGNARPDGRQQNARRARGVIGAFRHEATGVLVLDQREGDAGRTQRLHHGQHLAAGHAESVTTTGVVEPTGDDLCGGQLGCASHDGAIRPGPWPPA